MSEGKTGNHSFDAPYQMAPFDVWAEWMRANMGPMTATPGASIPWLMAPGVSTGEEAADLPEALHRAIAMHRYSCTWTKVPAGWVVSISFPEPRRFFGTTLEEALAWCLAWVRARETRRS